MDIALMLWGGLATIIAAVLGGLLARRPRTRLLRVGSKDGRFGGFTVSVSHLSDSSMVLKRDGVEAVRCRIVEGRAVIEWDDSKFTDIMGMTSSHLRRFGPPGAIAIGGASGSVRATRGKHDQQDGMKQRFRRPS